MWPFIRGHAIHGVSIIVPTYNEAENISDLISLVDRVLQRMSIPGEILIVDDSSPDGTAEKARSTRTVSRLVVIVRKDRRDLSAAVLEGFRQARYEVLVVCDADLSHPVEMIPRLTQPILDNLADMVVGSRYATGGHVEGWSWQRKLFSRTARLSARPLVKVKDPMSGFLALRKSALSNARLQPTGYKIGLELMVRLNLRRVMEVPITFRDRRSGKSKMRTRVVLDYLRQFWRLAAFELGFGGNPVSRWVLGIILGATAILHLIVALTPGLIPEEAYHWNYAQHLALSYLDHPPMVGWMIWSSTLLFGDTRLGVRLPAILASIATAFLIYRITHLISVEHTKRNGLLAVLVYYTVPYFWGLGFISMPDTFLILFWTATLFSLCKVLAQGRIYWWYGAGVSLGLGMLSKYTAVLLALGLFLFLIRSRPNRVWLARKEPYLAGFLALLLFSPVVLWNVQHDWASFRFQTVDRFREFRPISAEPFIEFLVTQALAFWPATLVAMLCAAGKELRPLVTAKSEGRRLLMWSFLPTFLVFAFVGLRTEVHISWPAPAYLGLIPLVATTIGALPRQGRRLRLWRRLGLILLFSPLAFYPLAALYLPIFGVPLVGKLKTVMVWEELARRVAQEQAKFPSGSSFVFADGRYEIASQIAFHLRASRGVYSQNVIGRNGVSFNYWGDLKSILGKDAIFVDDDTVTYRARELERHFDRVDPPEEVEIRKGRQRLGTFFIIRCYGYRGPVPESNGKPSRGLGRPPDAISWVPSPLERTRS